MRQKLLAASFVIAGTLLTGCAAHGAYYGSYYGPPAPRYGVVGVAPGPGYIWAEGYWDRAGERWAWREGRWVRPPRPHAVWVAPRWERHGHNWRYHEGRWR